MQYNVRCNSCRNTKNKPHTYQAQHLCYLKFTALNRIKNWFNYKCSIQDIPRWIKE